MGVGHGCSVWGGGLDWGVGVLPRTQQLPSIAGEVGVQEKVTKTVAIDSGSYDVSIDQTFHLI